MKYVYASIILIFLIGLFILFYLLNKKVEKPDGCEINEENCKGCNNPLCHKSNVESKGDNK